jgi:sialic acid synthase SpsE
MGKPVRELIIDGRKIGDEYPTYFIADIAANHDGDLERAKKLIRLAAEAGADAAKFQHFTASSIVCDEGFKQLGSHQSHQAKWKKSVFEVYQDASIDLSWTPILREICDQAGITFFTSPYSYDLVDHVEPFVTAYKIGSGDITWDGIIEHIAKKNKPYILAAGASTIDDVKHAAELAIKLNPQMALLQCNTNYTGSLENFRFINLNVLKTFRELFPEIVLGLSDHTPGHSTVLGAIALGARIIEKHFTDDKSRKGPDHAFSMDPVEWRNMVDRSRELELALGTGYKKVEENEKETVILQRRSIFIVRDINAGEIISDQDVRVLRPSPINSLRPSELGNILGRKLNKKMKAGQNLKWNDIDSQ